MSSPFLRFFACFCVLVCLVFVGLDLLVCLIFAYPASLALFSFILSGFALFFARFVFVRFVFAYVHSGGAAPHSFCRRNSPPRFLFDFKTDFQPDSKPDSEPVF